MHMYTRRTIRPRQKFNINKIITRELILRRKSSRIYRLSHIALRVQHLLSPARIYTFSLFLHFSLSRSRTFPIYYVHERPLEPYANVCKFVSVSSTCARARACACTRVLLAVLLFPVVCHIYVGREPTCTCTTCESFRCVFEIYVISSLQCTKF